MTRIAKLVLISALTGALGVVGCSEDTAGTGGTGGSGGIGVACGGTPPRTIEADFQVDVGGATCEDPIAGAVTVPITVKLAAKPTDTLVEGENEFELQVETTLEEDTIEILGIFFEIAEIDEDSVDVGSDNDTDLVNVAESPVPCIIDSRSDPDGNGKPGPITVVTPVTTGSFTVSEGTVTLTAEEITFDIGSPVPLKLTTRDESGGGGNGGAGGASGAPAPCTWDDNPSLTFEVGVGGNGGNGGAGGTGGT